MTTLRATEKQVAFIKSLTGERNYAQPIDYATLGVSEASRLIGDLLKMPITSAPAVEVGMYRTADYAIYRVQASRETGNLYAKRLNIQGGFDYESGAIRKLRHTDKMTLDEAKAFGVETGLCCVCGAFLTDAKSVANGIGPVCAKRF
jgi:hypothetical protein